MANERTLTAYHMGVAFERLGLKISARAVNSGHGEVVNACHQRPVGKAIQLQGGDWRVSIFDDTVGRAFSRLELYL